MELVKPEELIDEAVKAYMSCGAFVDDDLENELFANYTGVTPTMGNPYPTMQHIITGMVKEAVESLGHDGEGGAWLVTGGDSRKAICCAGTAGFILLRFELKQLETEHVGRPAQIQLKTKRNPMTRAIYEIVLESGDIPSGSLTIDFRKELPENGEDCLRRLRGLLGF